MKKKKIFFSDPTGHTGIIFNIQRYSITDGPGIRTTVFLKGCPLKCLWCHNPEGIEMQPEIGWHRNLCTKCLKCIEVCPNKAIKLENEKIVTDEGLCELCGKCVEICERNAREIIGKVMTVEEVFSEVKEDINFYKESNGGVTFSGGEPLMQSEFVLNCFRKFHKNSIHTVLDTSGCGRWESLERILSFTDLVIYDLKQMDPVKHISYTGANPSKIWDNLKRVLKSGIAIWIRVPVIPGYNDDEENIKKTTEFITGYKNVKKIELLPYHQLGEPKYNMLNKEYKLSNLHPASKDSITKLNKIVASIH